MSLLSLVSSKASREKVVTDSFGQTTRHDVQEVNSSSVCQRGRDLFAVGTSGFDFFAMLFVYANQPARGTEVKIYIPSRKSVLRNSSPGSSWDEGPSRLPFQYAPWKEKQKPCLSAGEHIYGFKYQSQTLSKCKKNYFRADTQRRWLRTISYPHFSNGNSKHFRTCCVLINFAIPAPFCKNIWGLRKWVPICYLNTE